MNSTPAAVRPQSPPDAGGIPAPAIPINRQPGDMAALKKVASEFETVFAKMFLSSMRKTAPQTPLLHGGRGEEIFTELLDGHYAEALSHRGKGLGIADMIVRKYAAHVRATEDQFGVVVDTHPSGATAPDLKSALRATATGVNRHD